jgi:hypothetical protein
MAAVWKLLKVQLSTMTSELPIIFRPTALEQAHKHKRTRTLTTHRLTRPILRLKEV